MALRCTSCQIELPSDAKRCTRCLRQSTLVDGNPIVSDVDTDREGGVAKELGRRLLIIGIVMPLLGGLFWLALRWIANPWVAILAAMTVAVTVSVLGNTFFEAMRRRETLAGAGLSLRKAAGQAAGVIVAVGILLALRALMPARSQSGGYASVSQNVALARVDVTATETTDEAGRTTLHLRLRGGSFEEHLARVSLEVTTRPTAGSIIAWLPTDDDSIEHRDRAAREAVLLNTALSSIADRNTQLSFRFGEPPTGN